MLIVRIAIKHVLCNRMASPPVQVVARDLPYADSFTNSAVARLVLVGRRAERSDYRIVVCGRIRARWSALVGSDRSGVWHSEFDPCRRFVVVAWARVTDSLGRLRIGL